MAVAFRVTKKNQTGFGFRQAMANSDSGHQINWSSVEFTELAVLVIRNFM